MFYSLDCGQLYRNSCNLKAITPSPPSLSSILKEVGCSREAIRIVSLSGYQGGENLGLRRPA
ncbi:uncharacterized protein RAG0_15926 [Rhynchosporium agropyri]|uniref:Uncharacterized protein n=1 Tax=Rhynchosporium agropyri TaxID=914238 RepID=A0A1E1LN91_9HELO|nr:uncharacterized protein RAG0_15926 [Rhynchosporium agropyri]